MALYTTPDGRVIIGTGVTDGNDYHGYNGKRDIVIQLTEDGATTDGLNALEYLKSYAENAKAENKPIFPDGTRVFISANGYTKAVEADDVIIDGSNISIGGIVWNGSAWDYSGAGQVASGLPEVDADDNGKVLTVVDGAWAAANGGGSGGGVLVVNLIEDGTELFSGTLPNVTGYEWRSEAAGTDTDYYVDFTCDLSEVTFDTLSATIDGESDARFSVSYDNGTVTVLVGHLGKIPFDDFGYTSEEEIAGKEIVLFADVTARLDKTWQQIKDAPIAVFERETEALGTTEYKTFYKEGMAAGENMYVCIFAEHVNYDTITFYAPTASGYPELQS